MTYVVLSSCGLDLSLTLQDLRLDALHDFVNASPLVFVFGPSADDAERLKDVDDVVDAPAFHAELAGAGVQK